MTSPLPVLRALAAIAFAALPLAPANAACGDLGDPNLVHNCGFTAANVTNYTAAQGSCAYSGAAGASQVGSMLCDAASDGFGGFRFVVYQCLTADLVASTSYGLAVSARYASGPNVATCTVAAGDSASSDCSSFSASSVSAAFTPGTGAFLRSSARAHTTGSPVGGALVQVTCSVPSPGADFTIYLDDFFFGTGPVPLFRNGFEAAQEGWSAAVG